MKIKNSHESSSGQVKFKTRAERIIAITSFPGKGEIHADSLAGIASYAKNTLKSTVEAAKNSTNLHIDVLAEKLTDEDDYNEGRLAVKRVWKRNSILTFWSLFAEIYKNHKSTKTVLIEFELAMFGQIYCLFPFPLFLLALKLMGKRIVFVMHQVIPDIDEIAPHINLSENSLKTDLINIALKGFYPFIIWISSKIIVFEEDLKIKLAEFGNFPTGKQAARKIVVIPHGVEVFRNVPTKNAARKKLGINNKSFVILAFGFLAWYKGTDWLVRAIDGIKKKHGLRDGEIQLVLAGGPNPNHEHKEYYKRYIKNIMRASRENGFVVTGFVPEKQIPLYHKSCDLVVLPYRTFMSSSGPLSIAFSFKKPFLLSPKLKGLLESSDIKSLLAEFKVREKDVLFQNFDTDFERKLMKMQRNATFRKKIERLAGGARRTRSWNIIGQRYYEELVN